MPPRDIYNWLVVQGCADQGIDHGKSGAGQTATFIQEEMARILDFLVELFVSAFGITHPRAGQERTVRLVLGGALVGVLCIAMVISAFAWYQLHQ